MTQDHIKRKYSMDAERLANKKKKKHACMDKQNENKREKVNIDSSFPI